MSNYINLEDEQHNVNYDPKRNRRQKDEQNQKVINEFTWIDFDDYNQIEINYLAEFLKSNECKKVNYEALDLIDMDPNQNHKISNHDIQNSLCNRFNKYGSLTTSKGHIIDEYDMNDTFIDDSESNPDKTDLPVGILKSTLKEFFCIEGDMQTYLQSLDYQNRRLEWNATKNVILHSNKPIYGQSKFGMDDNYFSNIRNNHSDILGKTCSNENNNYKKSVKKKSTTRTRAEILAKTFRTYNEEVNKKAKLAEECKNQLIIEKKNNIQANQIGLIVNRLNNFNKE